MLRLKSLIPAGRFWIKLDGMDIKAAIQQSMAGLWNGDRDLLDGRLQAIRAMYDQRIAEVEATHPDNKAIFQHLEEDKGYLKESLNKAVKKYQDKFQREKASTEKLKELNWDIAELVDLSESATKFMAAYKAGTINARGHSNLRLDLKTYLWNLFIKKRTIRAIGKS